MHICIHINIYILICIYTYICTQTQTQTQTLTYIHKYRRVRAIQDVCVLLNLPHTVRLVVKTCAREKTPIGVEVRALIKPG